jgi:hypothetical protein
MLKLSKYVVETINGNTENIIATGYQFMGTDIYLINFIDENLNGLVVSYVVPNLIGFAPIKPLTDIETAKHYLDKGYTIDENGSLVGVEVQNNA